MRRMRSETQSTRQLALLAERCWGELRCESGKVQIRIDSVTATSRIWQQWLAEGALQLTLLTGGKADEKARKGGVKGV